MQRMHGFYTTKVSDTHIWAMRFANSIAKVL